MPKRRPIPSNATIKRIVRRETQKENARRKYGHPQTEICIEVGKDLFNTGGEHVARKFQKATSTKINSALEILNTGITPLGIMYEMLRGEREYDADVLEICKAMAGYVHPKLTAVALQVGSGNMTHEQALKELDKIPGAPQTIAALTAGEPEEEDPDVSGLEEIDASVRD